MSPGDYEGTFMRAGDSETRKPRVEEATGKSPSRAALAHWNIREKGALGTGAGGQPGMSCHCSLLPWSPGVLGTLRV